MMRIVLCFVMSAMVSTMLLWSGCGSSGDVVDRFCNANCKKLNECNLLGGRTVEACVTSCKDSGQQNIGGCTIAASAIDACIAAIEASSCPFVVPAACQNLCSGQGSEKDGGSGADSVGGSDTGGTDQADTPTAGKCNALQGSCVQVNQKDGTDCVEFANQLPVAIAGIKSKCQAGEDTTWHEGKSCRTSAPGMNFACEISSTVGCTTSYDLLTAQQKAAASQGCSMGGGRVFTP